MADSYDFVVIGGGPGGYVAAIRAAQLGMKVACVEKRASLGGTCLNIGCIPSKALLQSSEKFEEAKSKLAVHGVKIGSVELDLPGLMAHKDKVVGENTRGVEFLFRKNKIVWLKGSGRIPRAGVVEVAPANGGAVIILDAKNIVIATGSDYAPLPGVEVDEKRIVSSTGALALEKVPEHFVVVGGGYIGLEMGSVWRRLGAQVTVVEFLDRITPTLDGEIGGQLRRRDVEMRRRAGRDRPPPLCRQARRQGGRRRLRRQGPHQDRRAFPHLGAVDLRDRRRDRRADAGAQGRGGGRGGGRADRRSEAARELRCDPGGGLYLARGRLGRQDRGGAEGRRRRLQGRQVPVHGERARAL